MNKRQKKKQRTKAIKELQKAIVEARKEITDLSDVVKWGDDD